MIDFILKNTKIQSFNRANALALFQLDKQLRFVAILQHIDLIK